MPKAPCQHCEKRAPYCHDYCDAYKDFRKQHDEEMRQERLEKVSWQAYYRVNKIDNPW